MSEDVNSKKQAYSPTWDIIMRTNKYKWAKVPVLAIAALTKHGFKPLEIILIIAILAKKELNSNLATVTNEYLMKMVKCSKDRLYEIKNNFRFLGMKKIRQNTYDLSAFIDHISLVCSEEKDNVGILDDSGLGIDSDDDSNELSFQKDDNFPKN